MLFEYIILIFIWIAGFASILIWVPREKWRPFIISIFMCRTLTWINILIHVHLDLISFPIREFPKATDVGFTTEYFLFPLLCAFYIFSEPKGSLTKRGTYLIYWVSGLVVIQFSLERFTNLISHENYTFYWVFINYIVIFVMTNYIYRWFFKNDEAFFLDRMFVR